MGRRASGGFDVRFFVFVWDGMESTTKQRSARVGVSCRYEVSDALGFDRTGLRPELVCFILSSSVVGSK